MTAEELKSIIAAGLPCEHLALEGQAPVHPVAAAPAPGRTCG